MTGPPPPAFSISINGVSSIDSGDSTTFSITATNNDGIVGDYEWSADGGSPSSGTNSTFGWTAPTVTSEMTVDIDCRAIDSAGTMATASTHSVTVNPPPDPTQFTVSISGASTVTSGRDSDYTASVSGVSSSEISHYSWTSGAGNFANSLFHNRATIRWTAPGPPTSTMIGVTAHHDDGSTASASFAINVVSPPGSAPNVNIHTGSQTVDGGDNLFLSSTVTGSPTPTLSWTGGGTFDDDDDDDTGWEAPSPTNQTDYTLRLTATNSEGEDFDEVTITVRGVPPPPTEAPSNSPSSLSESNIDQISARLSWSFSESQNTGDPATGFDIDWRRSSDSSYNRRTDNASPYSLSGLSASTSYVWRVRATNSGGDGPWSGTSSFTTDSPGPTLSAPNVTVHTGNMTVAGGATVNLDASISGNPTPSRTWSASPNAGTFGSTTSIDTTWEAPLPMAVTQYTLTLRATNSQGANSDSVIITVMATTLITLESTFSANAEFEPSISGGRALTSDQPDVPYLPSDGPVLGFFEINDIITHDNLNEMGPKLITTTSEVTAGKRGRWNLNVMNKDIRFDDGLAWQSAEFGFQILGEDGASSGDHSHRILNLQPETSNDNWIVYDYTTNTDTDQEREFRTTYSTTWNNNESMLVVGSCYVNSEVASGRIDIGYTSSIASSAEVAYTVMGQSSSGWTQLGQNNIVRFEVAALIVNSPSDEGTVAIKLTVLDRSDSAGQLVSGEAVGDNRLSIRATRIHIA